MKPLRSGQLRSSCVHSPLVCVRPPSGGGERKALQARFSIWMRAFGTGERRGALHCKSILRIFVSRSSASGGVSSLLFSLVLLSALCSGPLGLRRPGQCRIFLSSIDGWWAVSSACVESFPFGRVVQPLHFAEAMGMLEAPFLAAVGCGVRRDAVGASVESVVVHACWTSHEPCTCV